MNNSPNRVTYILNYACSLHDMPVCWLDANANTIKWSDCPKCGTSTEPCMVTRREQGLRDSTLWTKLKQHRESEQLRYSPDAAIFWAMYFALFLFACLGIVWTYI